jgi:nitrate/nitrite transport system substrate-binding protein
VGFTVATSQQVWTDHPEKVLGTTADWVAKHPNAARALTAAVLDASRWIDASEANRKETARTIAARSYVNTDVDIIEGRILGDYEDGLGKRWQDAHSMRFFNDGAVNFPWLSDGMWFLTQHRRWGGRAGERDAQRHADRRREVGWFRTGAVRRRIQGQGLNGQEG